MTALPALLRLSIKNSLLLKGCRLTGASVGGVELIALRLGLKVIGLGGIMNWRDAVEFILAGATAVQIGTANFVDPTVSVKVIDGIADYLDRHGFKSVSDIVGALEA